MKRSLQEPTLWKTRHAAWILSGLRWGQRAKRAHRQSEPAEGAEVEEMHETTRPPPRLSLSSDPKARGKHNGCTNEVIQILTWISVFKDSLKKKKKKHVVFGQEKKKEKKKKKKKEKKT